MNPTQKFLIEFYLDYVNNFLTIDAMAEHYEISRDSVIYMIKDGRSLHEFQWLCKNKTLS